MTVDYPYKLITPNCPDGLPFRSLESLLRFLSVNVDVRHFVDDPLLVCTVVPDFKSLGIEPV